MVKLIVAHKNWYPMQDGHYSYEQLADYADGILDSTTKLEINKHLRSCEICSNVVKGIHHYYENKSDDRQDMDGYLEQRSKAQLNELETLLKETGVKRNSNAKQGKIVSLLRAPLSKAAIWLILLVIPAGLMYQSFQNSAGSFDKTAIALLAEQYPEPSNFKGDDASLPEEWKLAMNAYKAEKYEHVSFLMSELEMKQELTSEQEFYWAISLLQLDPPQFLEAERILNKIDDNKGKYLEQSNWFKALLLAKNNNEEEAKEVLQQIVEEKTWNYQKAEDLLKN